MIGQCVSDYKSQSSGESTRSGMTLEVISADDIGGSADALRCVNDRIRGDVLCVNSDFISQFSLGDMARHHRRNASDVTILLAAAPLEENDKKGLVRKIKIEEEEQEYIGESASPRQPIHRDASDITDPTRCQASTKTAASSSSALRTTWAASTSPSTSASSTAARSAALSRILLLRSPLLPRIHLSTSTGAVCTERPSGHGSLLHLEVGPGGEYLFI